MVSALLVVLTLLSSHPALADSQDDFQSGQAAEAAGRYGEARSFFLKAMAEGSAEAQTALSDLYWTTLGGDRGGHVADGINLFDRSMKAALKQKLESFANATGFQIAVISLAELFGRSTNEWGNDLGRAWGMGQPSERFSVLLVFARKEGAVFIHVSPRLQSELPLTKQEQILHDFVEPYSNAGYLSGGLIAAANAVITILEEKNRLAKQPNSPNEAIAGSVGSLVAIMAFVAGIGLLFALFGGRGPNKRRIGLPTELLILLLVQIAYLGLALFLMMNNPEEVPNPVEPTQAQMDEYDYDVDHGIQPTFTPASIHNPNPLAPFLRGLGITMFGVWFIWGIYMTVVGAFVIDPAARRARAAKSDASYFDT